MGPGGATPAHLGTKPRSLIAPPVGLHRGKWPSGRRHPNDFRLVQASFLSIQCHTPQTASLGRCVLFGKSPGKCRPTRATSHLTSTTRVPR